MKDKERQSHNGRDEGTQLNASCVTGGEDPETDKTPVEKWMKLD